MKKFSNYFILSLLVLCANTAMPYMNYGVIEYGGPGTNSPSTSGLNEYDDNQNGVDSAVSYDNNSSNDFCTCQTATDVPSDPSKDGVNQTHYGCAPATGNGVCSFGISANTVNKAISVKCPNSQIPSTVYIYCTNRNVSISNSGATDHFSLWATGDTTGNANVNINEIVCNGNPNSGKDTKISASNCTT